MGAQMQANIKIGESFTGFMFVLLKAKQRKKKEKMQL